MNLLIVDDEVLAIQGIMNCIDLKIVALENIFTANSYKQAIEVISNNSVDIILCDIEMPNGNGLELIEWINKKYPLMIKIILSCHDKFQFAKRAVQLGCMDYLLKPTSTEDLMSTLKKAVSLAQENIDKNQCAQLGKHYQQYVHELSGNVYKKKDEVEQVRNYIIDHISEELSVSKLASMVFLSSDYLSRSFKKKYGKSVIDFIVDYRIELAAQMLKNEEMSFNEICEKVGFGSNYSYFVKQFKKKYVVSPKYFRDLEKIKVLKTNDVIKKSR